MKRRTCIQLVVCALVLGSMFPVVAATDYNLQWGFEVGDQFHFRKSGTPLVPVVDYYVEIDSIPFNPASMNNLTYDDLISYVNFYTCYNEDGSEMEQPEAISALPIGNWSYFEEFWNEASFITEWIDTDTEWGFVVTLDSSYANVTTTIKFSKTDGVMTFRSIVTEPDEGVTTSIQTERRDSQTNQLLSPEIAIGIGVGIVALVIVGAGLKFRQN